MPPWVLSSRKGTTFCPHAPAGVINLKASTACLDCPLGKFRPNLLWAKLRHLPQRLFLERFSPKTRTVKCARCPTGYGRGNIWEILFLQRRNFGVPNVPAGSGDDIICQACQVGRFEIKCQETLTFHYCPLVGTSQRKAIELLAVPTGFYSDKKAMDLDTRAVLPIGSNRTISIQQVVRCPKAKRPGWRAPTCSTSSAGRFSALVAHVHQGCIARAEIQTRQNVILPVWFIKNQKSKPVPSLRSWDVPK